MLGLEFLLGMANHEFTQEQLNGPKNVLGYPETPYKQVSFEVARPTKVVFESSHKQNPPKKHK